MKKFLYLALLPLMMLMMTLTSCSKDDDSPLDGFDYPAETLYGTWKITKAAGFLGCIKLLLLHLILMDPMSVKVTLVMVLERTQPRARLLVVM